MLLQSSQHSAEQPAAFYRFYLLQADDHFARRREDYFADDAAAIGAAKHVIGDFSGVEIWCGPRKVITLSREAAARLQPPRMPPRAALLISRNQRLLQQAAAARRRTETLRARLTAPRHSDCVQAHSFETRPTRIEAENSRALQSNGAGWSPFWGPHLGVNAISGKHRERIAPPGGLAFHPY
jgi:hypothetical protein